LDTVDLGSDGASCVKLFFFLGNVFIMQSIVEICIFKQHPLRIGGLVVKLAVAIYNRSIRLAPGSIPGRCITFVF
jgi:hypothetical protein